MDSPRIDRQPGTKPNNWKMNSVEHVAAIVFAANVPDGSEFLDKMVKKRFDSNYILDNKIEACRQLADNFASSTDHWVLARVQEIQSISTTIAATTALLDLYRGYSETEKNNAVANAESRRTALLFRINQTISDNEAMLRAIPNPPQQKPGERKHKEAYKKNVTTLKALKVNVTGQSKQALAKKEISQLAANRHLPGMSSSFWFAPLTNENWVIDDCDADRVTFPFRFLIHAPLQIYYDLLTEWKRTKDTAIVVSKIATEVFTAAYGDTLISLFKETLCAHNLDAAGILGVLGELRDALLNSRLQSVTLLAVTQTEGMIWRYADFLNRSNCDVYETDNTGKKIAGKFLWDRSAAAIVLNPTGKQQNSLAKQRLVSVRALLERTRIEQAFRPNVVGQVIAEYADDRNSLAHGSLIADKRLAVQAALLLGTVYQCIAKYEAEGRPHRTV